MEFILKDGVIIWLLVRSQDDVSRGGVWCMPEVGGCVQIPVRVRVRVRVR